MESEISGIRETPPMPEQEWEFVQPVSSTTPRGAEEASEPSRQDSGSPPPPRDSAEPPHIPPILVPIEQIYQDAMDQARELLVEVDPRFQDVSQANTEELRNLCEQMAQDAVTEELRIRSGCAKEGETPTIPQAVPHIKASRRRCAAADPASTKETEQETLVPDDELGNRWRYLVWKIQANKRWSLRATMFKYSKRMPNYVDGPARGMGKHLGRWSWREIASEW